MPERNYLKQPVSNYQLADWLGLEIIGKEQVITHAASLDQLNTGSLGFARKNSALQKIKAIRTTIIAMQKLPSDVESSVILTADPRLSYARALLLIQEKVGFHYPSGENKIDPTAIISPSAHIGSGVEIGARTIIGPLAVIYDGVKIGQDCRIKSAAVIGDKGFGFATDEQKIPTEVIHLGNTIIGNRVEVGSLTTVCQGTLSDTIIEDDVKLDDHVHIAHNAHLHRGATIAANATLSGRSKIEENVYIGPGAIISNGIKVKQNAKISLGAVVVKDVDSGETVSGNFAMKHKQFLRHNLKAKK